MAARFANLFRREPKPPRQATPNLSHLQKAILCWLYREMPRHQGSAETMRIPFAHLVHGLAAEKTELVLSLRRLMKKDLLEVILPRGEWTRYVSLTTKGETHAKTLSKDIHTFANHWRSSGKSQKKREHDSRERRRS